MRRPEVRLMTVDDLDDVVNIENSVSSIPWSRRLFEEELERGAERRYTVALAGSCLVGYLGMLYIADEAHIANVAVARECWGQRVASWLVLDSLQAACEVGIRDCTLEVRISNKRAKQLYQRFGFAPVALRRGYYHDNGEDAIIMWLYDLDSDPERLRRCRIRASLEGGENGE